MFLIEVATATKQELSHYGVNLMTQELTQLKENLPPTPQMQQWSRSPNESQVLSSRPWTWDLMKHS